MTALLKNVLDRLEGVAQSGSEWNARCPAHSDRTPSLSVGVGDGGRILLCCHAGCSLEEILFALTLPAKDLFPDGTRGPRRGGTKPPVTISALATDKLLPETFLAELGLVERNRAVEIPYKLLDGSPARRHRRRISLRASEGSCWSGNSGDPIVPYGLSKLDDARRAGFLILVEGESDCWTLWHHGFPALGIPGATMSKTLQSQHLDGIRRLYIICEPDQGGTAFVRGLARRLAALQWSGEVKAVDFLEDTKDPNALHKRDPTAFSTSFQVLLDVAKPLTLQNQANATHRDLPQIVAKDRQLREISTDAVSALVGANSPPRLFVRGGLITRVLVDEKGRAIAKSVNEAELRGALTRSADYVRPPTSFGNNLGNMHPPMAVVQDILGLGLWPDLPTLDAIVQTPVFRPDGTILDCAGYDASTNLFLQPPSGFKLPKVPWRPTRHDIENALLTIDEVIGQFPYVNQCAKANAIGLLLTPMLRHAIGGKVPLALLNAPQAGTGKSLLAEVISVITTGSIAAMIGAPHEEEEWRKLITSILLAGSTMIIFDNVAHPLISANLARALTAAEWKDRLLGTNTEVILRQLATWMATGNNIRLGGDLARRCYEIRIDAKMARPQTRQGFKHPRLLQWTTENRSQILAALLIVVRGWYAEKRPTFDVPIIGGFEEWACTVGSILGFARVPGFLQNLDKMYETADIESSQWEIFLSAWYEQFGNNDVTVAGVIATVESQVHFRTAMPETLLGVFQSERGSFACRLGKALAQRVEARFGNCGYYVQRGPNDDHAKVARWRVLRSENSAGIESRLLGARNTLKSTTSEESAGVAGIQSSRLWESRRGNGATNVIAGTTLPRQQACKPANPAGDPKSAVNKALTGAGILIPQLKSPTQNIGDETNRDELIDPCPACGSCQYWRGKTGNFTCGRCHPPAVPELVAEWIGIASLSADEGSRC